MVLAIAGGVWWLGNTSNGPFDEFAPEATPATLTQTNRPTNVPESVTVRTLLPGEVPLGNYQNKVYNFSLRLPEGMTVKEYQEGGGASTISFENRESVEGFQIFVFPYNADKISEERFRQDVPSGVRENQRGVTIHDAEGVIFHSNDALLGRHQKCGLFMRVFCMKSQHCVVSNSGWLRC